MPISCRLNGGLGNCMFQIASTYAIAKDHGDTCAFDFSMIPVYQGCPAESYRKTIYKKLRRLAGGTRGMPIYREKGYGFNKVPYRNNMMLVGYFGHEAYFAHHKKDIVELFKHDETIRNIKNKYSQILTNSVSLHVRRGDYLKFSKVYVLLTPDYYKRALETIESKAKIHNILVFSDDIEWCKENIKDPRITYIHGEPDYVDLYLMALTNHNILANSSFSWWGTYLNENPDKIVCAPRKWFRDGFVSKSEYLYCDNWIKINNIPEYCPPDDSFLSWDSSLLVQYGIKMKGVIHVGAHYGQEYHNYVNNGIKNIMLFEPVTANYNKLLELLPKGHGAIVHHMALGNTTGEVEMFIETANWGQSSSILEPGSHLSYHPQITFDTKESVKIDKLDNVPFGRSLYNILNIDVQGYELEVLRGASKTLPFIDAIYTEVNTGEVYKGCGKMCDMDKFLSDFGFTRIFTHMFSGVDYGDAIYIKQ